MRRKTTVKRSAVRNGGSIVEKIALNLEYLLYMTRKLLSNIRGEGRIPDGVIKTIARAVLADAGAIFATEEGRPGGRAPAKALRLISAPGLRKRSFRRGCGGCGSGVRRGREG